jgi:hypothetical protein
MSDKSEIVSDKSCLGFDEDYRFFAVSEHNGGL